MPIKLTSPKTGKSFILTKKPSLPKRPKKVSHTA